MMLKKGIYAIADCSIATECLFIKKTEAILKADISAFQYRNKKKYSRRYPILAAQCQALCQQYHTPFIINDDVQLAFAIGADGVHLGAEDDDIYTARRILGQHKIIGISCYNDMDRAVLAASAGADYIALGAFFSSLSKPEAVKADLNLIAKAKKKLSIPVVAIGGITTKNGLSLVRSGADMLAVISGLYAADNPADAALEYKKLFQSSMA